MAKRLEDILKNNVIASFHVHTEFSGDPYLQRVKLEKVLNYAFKKNIGMLVITDSNNNRAFNYLIKNYKELKNDSKFKIDKVDGNLLIVENGNKQMIIPKAMEARSKEGHILLIGYKNINAPENYTVEDLTDITHDEGGIAIPAHPFIKKFGGVGREGLDKIKEEVDAVEVFNAQAGLYLKKFNMEAREYADQNNLSKICSNDSHDISGIAYSYMILPEEFINLKNGDQFISSLKEFLNQTKNPEVYNTVAHEQYEPLPKVLTWVLRHKFQRKQKANQKLFNKT